MLKNLLSILVPIALVLNVQSVSSSVSPERKMIADAIKIKASITPEDSTKIRLKKQENLLKIIDEIVDKYAYTEIGLELLTNNSYKNLNITKFREDYLAELTKYT